MPKTSRGQAQCLPTHLLELPFSCSAGSLPYQSAPSSFRPLSSFLLSFLTQLNDSMFALVLSATWHVVFLCFSLLSQLTQLNDSFGSLPPTHFLALGSCPCVAFRSLVCKVWLSWAHFRGSKSALETRPISASPLFSSKVWLRICSRSKLIRLVSCCLLTNARSRPVLQ